MTDSLHDRRVHNSALSQGISHGPIYDAVLRRVSAHVRGRVLDFGAGTGNMTARLAAEPAISAVVGADLMPAAAELPTGATWVQADLNEPLPIEPRQFDAIVAVEIIEHLENPRAIAREWRRLLRPGGVLVMSTPNVECVRSLLALVVRGHFLPFTEPWYPAHITALTAEDVRRVLREAGFVDIEVGYTDHGRIPKLALTWQAASLGVLRGRRYSDNLVAVARVP